MMGTDIIDNSLTSSRGGDLKRKHICCGKGMVNTTTVTRHDGITEYYLCNDCQSIQIDKWSGMRTVLSRGGG